MTDETELSVSKARLIAALDAWPESVDPCEHGHVEHGPEAHIGRKRVHTMAGGLGADWDYDEAVAFIEAADLVVRTVGWTAATGHGEAARSDGRFVAFATRAEDV